MSSFSNKQKFRFGFIMLLAIVLIATTFYYLKYRHVSASEAEARGEIVWQTKINEDINNDGKSELIYLTSYNSGQSKSSYISTRLNIFRQREQKLIGFEEDLAFCPHRFFKLADGSVALCVFGEVGVHSQNVQILRWSDFSTLNFIDEDGNTNYNMISDSPYFDFNYAQTDKLKIFFDNRDYDKDPLVDNVRIYYYLDKDVFRYDGVERIYAEGSIK